MKYYAKTDIGKKYDHNEDAYVLPEPNKKYNINNPDVKNMGELFVLCDGIGGFNVGEIASELTANWVFKDYYSIKDISINLVDKLEEIIKSVNTKIINLATEHERYHGMGTTLVAVLIFKRKAFIYSVGDSRVYILNKDNLIQITEDQSEIWQLYKSGEISKDDIRYHPRNNIITMALGIKKNIDIQRYVHEYNEGDIILLCSDGLSDMISDMEIKNILIKNKSLNKITNKLINAANKNGGKDNITVIVVKV